jgi:hypothetical protein
MGTPSPRRNPVEVWPWVGIITSDETARIQAAYDVLTKLGQQTAAVVDATWDTLLDEAHQKLGVMLAVITAASCPVCTGEVPAGQSCGGCGRAGPQ